MARLQEPQPRAPLALAAAAFASGIWLAGHLLHPPGFWGWTTALLVLCALSAAGLKSARLAWLSSLLALFCAGAFARVATPVPRIVLPPAEFMEAKDVEIMGHVTNDGVVLAAGGSRERFDLQTDSIQLGGITFNQPFGMRATVFTREPSEENTGPDTPIFPLLNYGDRVRLKARLRLPRNFRNPGAFDYEGYLRGIGIGVLASVKAQDIELLPGRSGTRLGFWRSRIRHSILQHMRERGLWSRDDAALFAAMVLGDDSMLLRNVREEFQETGVYHLLVVSGMNVALLAFAVFWLARRLRCPDWAASAITIALSVFYAYIAGAGVPIQRAVLMLSLFLIARLLYRDRSSLNATGFAALAVLVFSPGALFEAGFQLTFLALLAITGIGVPILQRTSAPYRTALRHFDSTSFDLGLPPQLAQFRLDLRLVAGRLQRFLGRNIARLLVVGVSGAVLAFYELALVSAVTQAVLVLPMRTYFHRAAIIGLPANILVLPLAGIMLNSAVAAVTLSYIFVPVARLAGMIAAGALHWTLLVLNSLSHLHIAQWRIPDAGPLLVLLAAMGIVVAHFAVSRQRWVAIAGIAVLFASAAVAAFHSPPPRIERGKLEITAIDVGQGDSLLVISPEGRTMLIDAGGSIGPVHSEFEFGEDVVAPYLWSRGLEHLDVAVLTHAHGDHIGGLARILEDFHPSELWVGINSDHPALTHVLETAARNHIVVNRHTAGDAFTWGGATIRVLSPPPDWTPRPKHENDDSLALLITYGDTSALLAGDLVRKMEQFVATESPHADLLKVAHHGSATSTTSAWLEAVHPKVAVISAGRHNSFGHPRLEVLERLQNAGVATYRTDMLGVVTFLLDGKTVQSRVTLLEK
ncbi:MAG TPA: DNA internalization-related competence protein ComEC/Rec2 [Candidatus Angelobacter sp.]|nr:DNA internalization-related competence protein ComEC/Rec2 [Candidatus Angelobacter sp.]